MKQPFSVWSAFAWLAVLGSVASAQDSAALAYRVAGTIELDDQPAIALIESSAGTQQAYDVGDYVDDWVIVDIDLKGVTFSRAGQNVWLPLEGELTALAAEPQEYPYPNGIQATSEPIDFSKAFEGLKALESKSNIDLNHAAVNKVLGLSADTRIREVDGETVASPMDAVQLSMVALSREMPFRLTLSENDWDEMYLMPLE